MSSIINSTLNNSLITKQLNIANSLFKNQNSSIKTILFLAQNLMVWEFGIDDVLKPIAKTKFLTEFRFGNTSNMGIKNCL